MITRSAILIFLTLAFTLLAIMASQPYSPCYSKPPQIHMFYYKNGKLIRNDNVGSFTGIYGTGVSNSTFIDEGNNKIDTDSIVFKLR